MLSDLCYLYSLDTSFSISKGILLVFIVVFFVFLFHTKFLYVKQTV